VRQRLADQFVAREFGDAVVEDRVLAGECGIAETFVAALPARHDAGDVMEDGHALSIHAARGPLRRLRLQKQPEVVEFVEQFADLAKQAQAATFFEL